MKANDNSQADRFWQEKENEYNGKIQYKTFTRLIGTLQSDEKELSGLLYIINDTLIFEDFEKDGGIMGMLFKAKKADYEKTVLSIHLNDITDMTEISQGTASARISGQPGPSRPISNLGRFFSIVVNEILTENGDGYYFEVLDKSSLSKAIEEAKNS